MQKGRFSLPRVQLQQDKQSTAVTPGSGDAVVKGRGVFPGVARMAQEVTLCPQHEQGLCQLVSRGG